MIEILVGVYAVSFLLSALLTGATLFTMNRRFHSRKLGVLNTNLALVQLYWSNAQSNFAPLTENAVELDRTKALRDFGLVGLILCFLSAPGFLFLCLFVLSMQILARPRLEKAVFSSVLATTAGLSATAVTEAVSTLAQR